MKKNPSYSEMSEGMGKPLLTITEYVELGMALSKHGTHYIVDGQPFRILNF